ncbi:putative 1,4-beta-D-xylan synthase [Helianthus annuus]|nr:putative 1,4-beta-D-xylan synthase [Helianthus annuus]
MNTVISAMALNYPVEKLSVYLSDDGGCLVTLEAMREALKFAKLWVPFCKKYGVKTICPEAYFTSEEDVDEVMVDSHEFGADKHRIKGDYLSAMENVYGPNFSEYPDDPAVWARVIGEGRTRRVYGIGSSDLNYLVTGTSSSAGSAPSQAEYQRSQEEAQVMRTRMVDFEARVEEERNLIVSRLEEEMNLLAIRLDDERKAREELQKQLQEFMKNWRPPSN